MRPTALWLLAVLCLGVSPARADEPPPAAPASEVPAQVAREDAPAPPEASADAARTWSPQGGARTAATRTHVRFHGLLPTEPIRLHLTLGGFTEGVLGGVDRDRGAVLLLDPSPLWVELSLVGAVTPLGGVRPTHDRLGALLPEPVPADDPTAVRYRLRPTWRSHLGVLLSALLPGTGQFIQEDNRRVGWVFLSAWSFVVAAGALALAVPPHPVSQERGIIAASFFGIGAGFNVVAAIHAFQQGRRRVPVGVVRGGAPLTSQGPNE